MGVVSRWEILRKGWGETSGAAQVGKGSEVR